MGKKVLIIGGVAAGMKTASRLRRRDKDAEITVRAVFLIILVTKLKILMNLRIRRRVLRAM